MPKTPLPAPLRAQTYCRDEWKCRHCGNRSMLDPHHVVHRSAGGEHALWNLLTLCRKCHEDEHAGRLRIEIIELYPTDLKVRFWRMEGWEP
jgi:5-methylcytosine-specific restriction endonuclease McrA